jgi:aspartate 1-decarboxylase
LETYVIKGKRGTGVVCLNGPAARQGLVGDIIIIISYAAMNVEEAKTFKPTVVLMGNDNKFKIE